MGRGERALPHLYVHVPFCAHRCGYCDFVTVTGAEDLRGRYVDALIAELRAAARPGRSSTVFVGGGTPSLLDDELLARLLAALPASERADRRVQSRDDHDHQGSSAGRGWSDRASRWAPRASGRTCWRPSSGWRARKRFGERSRRSARPASKTSTST